MTFEDAMRDAALTADQAVKSTMQRYRTGKVTDEPEITGELIGQMVARFDGKTVGGIKWDGTVVRHGKGLASEEKRLGADLLMHVSVETPTLTYSKGVLIQAKRVEPDDVLGNTELEKLRGQCIKMLKITPASFVFDYVKGQMRVGPATRFSGTKDGRIYKQCTWRSYRFFWELFRCPIGDPRITSAKVPDLPVHKIIHLKGAGQFSDDVPR